MARTFKISRHRNSENLHLKLMGDFDGALAHQLLKVLKTYGNRTSRVFIHTSCLRNIYPFGVNVFHDNLGILRGQSLTLIFTGEHASQLAPEKSVLSDLIISTVSSVAGSGATISRPPSLKME
ncbi:MAG: hypothetical protein JRJ77_10935 [Deltaproteobacteria bacterium]|nr:hypothetical protein [Deltaproteobacteria bacterium]MBW2341287.1 hypothetical protein [Deltaproteobacteria bacterium]